METDSFGFVSFGGFTTHPQHCMRHMLMLSKCSHLSLQHLLRGGGFQEALSMLTCHRKLML
jgi:hypothetical protein